MYLSVIYDKSPLLVLLMFWAMLPFGQFLVGWIFESRTVPLFSGQARLFFPGDLAIGIIMTGLVGLNVCNPVKWDAAVAVFWHLAIATVALVIFYILRKNDAGQYPIPAGDSPTKWYHDICGYFISIYFILSFGLPQVVKFFLGSSPIDAEWAIVVAGAIIYAACAVYDAGHPATYADMLARHPVEWHPIWRR